MLSLFSGESGLNESLIIALIKNVDFGQMQESIEHVLIGFHILIKNLNIVSCTCANDTWVAANFNFAIESLHYSLCYCVYLILV